MIPSCLLALEEICPGHWGGLHPGTLYLASEQQDGRKFKENAQKQDHPGERRRLRTLNLHFDVERERENESVSEETRLGNNIKTLNKGNKRRQKELESWNGNKDADICACTLSKHSYTCLCMLNDCVSLIPQLCVCVCVYTVYANAPACVWLCKILECWQSEHITALLSLQCADKPLAARLVRASESEATNTDGQKRRCWKTKCFCGSQVAVGQDPNQSQV